MPAVYITSPIPEIGFQLLLRENYKVDINNSGNDLTEEELKKIVGEYDAILSFLSNKIDANVVDFASNRLKVISNYAVGYDNIDIESATKRGIIVCNTPGVANESVAEHTFAMIFALSKKLFEQDKYVRAGKFNKWDSDLFLSHQLWGQTIGIIGLGRIGTFVGQIGSGGFRMKVLYYDIKRSEDFEFLTGAEFASISLILKEADIVALHVPLNEKTKHLIGEKEFKLMKNSAILINTARGSVVDEKALCNALKSGEIAGAGLDVFENEPKVELGLMKSDKVILTPHTASATYETRDEMSRIAAQNIIDVFENKVPIGLIKLS